MKQLKTLLTSILLATVIVFGCTEDEPEVDITDIKFDGEKVTVTEGFTVDLDTVLTVSGADADQAQISFTSGDATIVSVDGFTLTAVKAGSTTLTATEANSELTATVNVEVVAKEVDVTGVSLNQTEADLKVGDELQLTATIAPEDATEKGIIWSVAFPSGSKSAEDSPSAIATVSDQGLVKAVSAGDVVVTAKTKDGEFTASIDISITNVAVTGVALGPDPIEVNVNEYVQLTATFSPENATNQKVTWSLVLEEPAEEARTNNEIVIAVPISAEDYAEIDENGKLKGKMECDGCGLMAVVTSEEGEFTDKLPVKITYIPVSSLTLNPNSYFEVLKGETFQMEYAIEPEDATNQEITWEIEFDESSCRTSAAVDLPSNYATINEDGIITGIEHYDGGCGRLRLYAYAADLRSPKSVFFNVVEKTTSLSIQEDGEPVSSINYNGCGSRSLDLVISPENASELVTWSSQSPDLLGVDQNGTISLGPNPPFPLNTTIKITVTANDGSGVTTSIDVVINYSGC